MSVVRPGIRYPGDRDASAKSNTRCGSVRDPQADLENESGRGPCGVFLLDLSSEYSKYVSLSTF